MTSPTGSAPRTSEWQRRVLEAIATGVELTDVLASIARFHEAQCPGVDCAVHLINDDGLTLRSLAPRRCSRNSSPPSTKSSIGPHATTCGVAAYRREQIVTTNIATDEIWKDHSALARRTGLSGLLGDADPIAARELLGVLALYGRDASAPSRVRASRDRVGDAARRHRRRSRARGGIAAPIRGKLPIVRREFSHRHLPRDETGRLLAVNASLVRAPRLRVAGRAAPGRPRAT